MNPLLIVLCIAAAVLAVLIGKPLWQAQRRRRLRAQPLPNKWTGILARTVPLYRRMPPHLRARWHGLIQQFIAEKEFVGCGGLSVTLEMKLAIAAYACLLVLNRNSALYEELYSILVYPDAFVAPQEEHDEAGVVSLHESVLSGEAWETHRIVLSWADTRAALTEPAGGGNVVLHEFAHYLDSEDGAANGAPWLQSAAARARWAQIMSEEYTRLRTAAQREEPTLLDPYGAEDPAEFFAVATETFFDRAADLQRMHGTLYSQLASYYGLDPASWQSAKEG